MSIPEKPRFKCGDRRADGMVFWSYKSAAHIKENWVTEAHYMLCRNRAIERCRKRAAITGAADKAARKLRGQARIAEAKLANGVRKHGDICPISGHKFWGYSTLTKTGEMWMTPEKFENAKKATKAWEKNLPKNHPRKLRCKNDEHYKETRRASARRTAKTPENRSRHAAKMRKARKRPLFWLACTCRNRLLSFLKSRGLRKHKRTEKLVGCTWEFLRAYLEFRFKPGMSWDNKGEWHVDHIIPLASASTEEEITALCHYTNLQPLWGSENCRKSSKILYDPPASLTA